MLRSTVSSLFSVSAALGLLAMAPLLAQMPPQQLLVGSFRYSGTNGLGGLFYVDPASGTVTPVTGLPCEVTGACTNPSTPWTGTDVAVHLPGRDELLANGPNWVGSMVRAYVVPIAGTVAGPARAYDLATYTTANGLGNPAAVRLPDERVLLAIDPTSMGAPGPLAGALLGVLDPSEPPGSPTAVVPVPIAPIPPGLINALAFDGALGVAYFAMNGAGTTDVYRVPVPQGGAPTHVATVAGITAGLIVEAAGTVLAGGWVGSGAAAAPRLYRIDPQTGAVTSFANVTGSGVGINALHVDPVSGDLLFALPGAAESIYRRSPCSPTAPPASLVTGGPAGGWGVLSSLDANASIDEYGVASGSTPAPRWHLAPNPGGSPTLGNAGFSLTSNGPATTLATLWVLGFSSVAVALPWGTGSVQLLAFPDALAFLPASSTLMLPIPNVAALAGVEVFAQCGHLDSGGGMAASSGVRVTLW